MIGRLNVMKAIVGMVGNDFPFLVQPGFDAAKALADLGLSPHTPRKHIRNRLMNRRNPNRPCKLLRRIKTTC